MREAQADGATVPIYYESRQVPVDVDRDELAAVAAVLETEEDEGAEQARHELGAAGEGRRRSPTGSIKVADDLAEHFTDALRDARRARRWSSPTRAASPPR